MKKFEYKFVEVAIEELNDLGKEGWEAITIGEDSRKLRIGNSRFSVLLKREVK